MTEEEIDQLFDTFYSEAPFDYVLTLKPRKRKFFLGSCDYVGKVCYIYGADNYTDALITMLHELAHSRVDAAKGHTNAWEREFVRLLDKYNVSKESANKHVAASGEAFKQWVMS